MASFMNHLLRWNHFPFLIPFFSVGSFSVEFGTTSFDFSSVVAFSAAIKFSAALMIVLATFAEVTLPELGYPGGNESNDFADLCLTQSCGFDAVYG